MAVFQMMVTFLGMVAVAHALPPQEQQVLPAKPAGQNQTEVGSIRKRRTGNPRASCVDIPLDWKDEFKLTCSAYVEYEWCSSEGGHGDGWIAYGYYGMGNIKDHVDPRTNTSALDACCGCGGGQREASQEATPGPTTNPTPGPTEATPGPTTNPTPGPTEATPGPTTNPTPGPTEATPGPTTNPTPGPTEATPGPTTNPTPGPTGNPTPGPTGSPTPGPTPTGNAFVMEPRTEITVSVPGNFSAMSAEDIEDTKNAVESTTGAVSVEVSDSVRRLRRDGATVDKLINIAMTFKAPQDAVVAAFEDNVSIPLVVGGVTKTTIFTRDALKGNAVQSVVKVDVTPAPTTTEVLWTCSTMPSFDVNCSTFATKREVSVYTRALRKQFVVCKEEHKKQRDSLVTDGKYTAAERLLKYYRENKAQFKAAKTKLRKTCKLGLYRSAAKKEKAMKSNAGQA